MKLVTCKIHKNTFDVSKNVFITLKYRKDGKPKRDPNAPKTKKSRKKLTDVSTKMLLQHGQSEFK